MKTWTQKMLVDTGYKIENAKITKVDLSMADHGCFTLEVWLKGSGWEACYGGYIIGKGYLGANDEYFSGYGPGIESVMRIMDIVGVDRFNDLRYKYVRVATKSWGDTIEIIGNLIDDRWFDIESFFKDKQE